MEDTTTTIIDAKFKDSETHLFNLYFLLSVITIFNKLW